MSKRSKKRRSLAGPPVARKRRPLLTGAALAACLVAALASATRFEPVRRAVGLAPLSAPAAQPQQGNLNLSKEYVYAGGRLVATEEPALAGGPSPTSLLATAASTTSVALTWAAPSSGSISSYVVERAQSKDGPFAQVGTAPANQLSFTDQAAVADTAYLYRVKAAYAQGGSSDYSNNDMATTVAFTDTPLQGVFIKADHLKEARRAVVAVRALAGLGAATWAYPDPVSSPPEQRRAIYLEDMLSLRTNLNPALSALGITPLPGDPTLDRGLPVKGAHIQDVRDKVK